VRGFAIKALWECEDVRLAERFLQLMVSDPDPVVQACAAEALGPFVERAELEEISAAVGSRLVEELIRAIRGKGGLDLRCRAVESIGYSSQSEVPALLRAAYRHAAESMRISAVMAMGRTADPDWAGSILPELKSRSARMRAVAAHAAGELSLREAVPVLVELLEDPEPDVRREAIGALGEIGGASARRALTAHQNRAEEDDELELLEEALENAEFQESLGDLTMLDQDADEDDVFSEEEEEEDADDEDESEDEE
jgi:HEAT repeat protein